MPRNTDLPGIGREFYYDSELMDAYNGDNSDYIVEDFKEALDLILRSRDKGGKWKGRLVIDVGFEIRDPEDES